MENLPKVFLALTFASHQEQRTTCICISCIANVQLVFFCLSKAILTE